MRGLPCRLALPAALVVVLACGGCSSSPRYRTEPLPPKETKRPRDIPAAQPEKALPGEASSEGADQVGVASYYAHKFHGRPTASGEIFDMNGLTAAHRELPLGTVIRVTHLQNRRNVIVKVNDRGPFIEGRILDLSLGAARELDMLDAGLARVRIDILKRVE